MDLVNHQGYLPLEREQIAPDIPLAGVKVSVTAVVLTEMISLPHYVMQTMFVIMKLMEGLLGREPHSV
jgi:hypothetical protein